MGQTTSATTDYHPHKTTSPRYATPRILPSELKSDDVPSLQSYKQQRAKQRTKSFAGNQQNMDINLNYNNRARSAPHSLTDSQNITPYRPSARAVHSNTVHCNNCNAVCGTQQHSHSHAGHTATYCNIDCYWSYQFTTADQSDCTVDSILDFQYGMIVDKYGTVQQHQTTYQPYQQNQSNERVVHIS